VSESSIDLNILLFIYFLLGSIPCVTLWALALRTAVQR